MGRILLVRHGQASLLSNDYDQLSPLGTQQSAILGRWLAARGERVDQVVMGDLRRHRQTAEACLAELAAAGVALPEGRVDARWNEFSHHELYPADHLMAQPEALARHLQASDNPRREFQAMFSKAFDAWVAGEHLPESGISYLRFRADCMAALAEVDAACGPGQTALIFTSGGPIAAVCQALLDMPHHKVADIHFPLLNGSVTRLMTQPGRITLGGFNSVAHLEAENNKAMVTYR